MKIRKKIYEMVDTYKGNHILSSIYSYFMIVVIIVSLVPLAFKETNDVFNIIDYVCVGIFGVDYLLRWITADYKYGKHNAVSFLRYPFSFLALIDLISILPTVTALNQGFKLLRIFRLLRAFRVFRVFRALRYLKNLRIIVQVLKNSRSSLTAVGTLAIGYVFVAALIIFNVEPESFGSFFDAVYWATISLTTVGYGDIYATSVAGQVVTMISSLLGIAIIALPSSIITAGYIRAIENKKSENKKNTNKKNVSDSATTDVTVDTSIDDKQSLPQEDNERSENNEGSEKNESREHNE